MSKTTTTVNLGAGLVREGKKVLVIDADPQGNLSQSLGIMNPDELDMALPDIMEQIIMDKDVDVTEGIVQHEERLDLMPCKKLEQEQKAEKQKLQKKSTKLQK